MRSQTGGSETGARHGAEPGPPDKAKVGVSWAARAFYAALWLPWMAFLVFPAVFSLVDLLDPPYGRTGGQQRIVVAQFLAILAVPGWLIWRLSTRSATATREHLTVRGMWRTRRLDWSAVHDLQSNDMVVHGRFVALGNTRAVFDVGGRIKTVTVSTSFRRGHAAALRLRCFAPGSHPCRRSCPEFLAWQTPETSKLANADPGAVSRAPVLAVYRPDPGVVVATELAAALLLVIGVPLLGVAWVSGLTYPVTTGAFLLAGLAVVALTAVLMIGVATQRVSVTAAGLVVRQRTLRTVPLPWVWIGAFEVIPAGFGTVVCVRRTDGVVVELPVTAVWQRDRAGQLRDELAGWKARCSPAASAPNPPLL